MPLVCDLEALPECTCNEGLEFFAKAMAENPGGQPETIWTPHESPWLAWHVEDCTRRLTALLERIRTAFSRVLAGSPLDELRKADDTPWLRWDATEFDRVRRQLEAKPPASYDLDDWMLLVEYLVQRYMPDTVISSEAEWLAVRATLLGKIQASIGRGLDGATPDEMAGLAELVPTRFAAIPMRSLGPIEIMTLRLAKQRAAVNISDVTDNARSKMKRVIVEHLQAQVLGQKEGQQTALSTRLFDDFGVLNRDMRRIAVTEAGDVTNNAYIASRPIGAKVRRREAYKGACDFCRSINGQVYRIVSADAPEKNGAEEVWVGKSNIGRSASPNRRQGGALVPRESAEMWWCAAGVQHPHCRGSWEDVVERPANVRPEFHDWMMETLARAGLRPVEPEVPA